MTDAATLDALLDAALPHVAFDGWSTATFSAAVSESGIDEAQAKAAAPRGAVDLAMALHRRGDAQMVAALGDADLASLRYREKVVRALELRVEALPDREVVRKAATLFAVPTYAGDGAKLIWETADHIWNTLGDTSTDGNWYSKRVILSGVWGSTVVFWLGDESPDCTATRDFIERRISNVMQFETLKGTLRKNPLTKPFMDMQDSLFGRIKAPVHADKSDLPGWRRD